MGWKIVGLECGGLSVQDHIFESSPCSCGKGEGVGVGRLEMWQGL